MGIRATDDKTLEVQLALPRAVLPRPHLVLYVLSPRSRASSKSRATSTPRAPTPSSTTVPIPLTTFQPDPGRYHGQERQILERRNVDIQKVEARVITEVDTAVNLYESGQLDVQLLSTAQY